MDCLIITWYNYAMRVAYEYNLNDGVALKLAKYVVKVCTFVVQGSLLNISPGAGVVVQDTN